MGNQSDRVESFKAVYEELFPLLFRIALHITGSHDIAEEMCQEAFIRYFNRSIPLATMNDAKYWLIRVVKNLCFNHEKRKQRERKALDRVKSQPQRPQETGESLALKDETTKAIQKALQELPYKLRAPLVLKEYGRMNYKQIAKVLGITEGNVKVRIFRARQQLEKFLDRGELYVS